MLIYLVCNSHGGFSQYCEWESSLSNFWNINDKYVTHNIEIAKAYVDTAIFIEKLQQYMRVTAKILWALVI